MGAVALVRGFLGFARGGAEADVESVVAFFARGGSDRPRSIAAAARAIYDGFAAALRSFLRQDPDVIMVGEIRDLETAQISIQASLTVSRISHSSAGYAFPATRTWYGCGLPARSVAGSAMSSASRIMPAQEP